MIYFSAFLLGLASSLHCVVMCGPIAMALPLGNLNSSKKAIGISLYSLGRISTYILLGLIAGLLGLGLKVIFLQDFISIVMGILLIVFALFPSVLKYFERKSGKIIWKSSLFSKKLGKLFKSNRMESLFYLGFLNGLIPCGLVYVAIASSLVLNEFYEFGIFMLLFGLGTIPLMALTILFGVELKKKITGKYRFVIPVFIFLLGVFLFFRPALVNNNEELKKGGLVGYVKSCIIPH